MRGEDNHLRSEKQYLMETPPHARGRLPLHFRSNEATRNTPACAGKTPGEKKSRQSRGKHPRMRGEDESTHLTPWSAPETPPHARGRRICGWNVCDTLRNTPACAGKTSPSHQQLRCRRKHPRMRGEDRNKSAILFFSSETPPHARGRHGENNG